ncbi:Alpha-glucosidase YihQ [Orchesella cincta]|uniref:Alpha-glucosidase YihQ n=1 Tax=Orchesella cincta TaxID=48709 RepID=A0A1D2N9X3_ORCCI|nr:Alpha-glucosidase YihQ [Orchesella cincta]
MVRNNGVYFAIVLIIASSPVRVHGDLQVVSGGETFTVIADSIPIIKHNISDPAFYLSSTNITFFENAGNFIITERNDPDAIPLQNFSVETDDSDVLNRYTIRMTNPEYPEHVLSLTLHDTEELNGVPVSCSFRVNLESPPDDTTFNRISMRTVSSSQDHIYGLGEQYSYLDLKGHNYTIWTREQGVGRNQSDGFTQIIDLGEPGAGGDFDYTYWPQSSYVSSESRLLFGLKSKAYAIFNFKNESFNEISLQATDVSGYFILDDSSLLSLVQKVSQVYGRQPELPDWVYNGAILGVQGGTQKMLEYLAEAQQYDVAVSAMWIQDWSGKITTSFGTRVFWNWKWNSEWYPDLDTLIKTLKDNQNIRVLSYINPSLNMEGDVFQVGDASGYFLRNESAPDQTYVQDFGDFFCGTVDVWNEEAVEWYKSIIKENMLEFGFSGWMADFGEYTRLDMVSSNQSASRNSQERHNQLPTLWARLNREAVEEAGLLNETMFWVRSGSSGSSRYATMLWNGDQNVDWSFSDGLPSTITAALSAGMSGMGLSHFDIGGYTTLSVLGLVRRKELLLRSAEYAVFTPVMRTHEGNQPAWNHQVYTDADTWQKFGRLTRMYKMLSNYTRAVVRENSQLGIPAMRPLFLHYETDEGSFQDWHEYLYGKDLLVAPVLYPNAVTRDTYLPPDTWVHLWDQSEAELTGPLNVTIDSPLGYPPVFYRKDSIWVNFFRNLRDSFA